MKTHNPANERIKRRYFDYLRGAKGYSEASIDAVAKALNRFEDYNRFRDFKAYHLQQAIGFKKHLAKQTNVETGKLLSKATLHATLTALRAFFVWLAGQPGFRSRFSYSDADYFNLSENEKRVARAERAAPVPTVEQILHVLKTMPAESEIERRDRAVIAFTLLTGARDNAVASFRLKHVDLAAGSVIQDAREVRTKFRKTFTTVFFPVDDVVRGIVEAWVRHLREEKLWGNDDPLFPKTLVAVGAAQKFEAAGLAKGPWSNATPIRKIFREAFALSGLPYFSPHSFRKTLVSLGQQLCRTPEEFKAWSQNLGHEDVLTTLRSYGTVSDARQSEILKGLGQAATPDADEVALIVNALQQARRRQRQ